MVKIQRADNNIWFMLLDVCRENRIDYHAFKAKYFKRLLGLGLVRVHWSDPDSVRESCYWLIPEASMSAVERLIDEFLAISSY